VVEGGSADAGIPPKLVQIMSDPSVVLGLDDPRHFELIRSAADLAGEGRYDFAVISSQTALEVYLELEVARLLSWRRLGTLGPAILDTLVPSYTFVDSRLQALWYALKGDDMRAVKAQDWWRNYPAHLALRNSIVHGGHTATADEADRSLETAMKAMAYIQEVTLRVGVDLGRIWETGAEKPPWHELPAHDRRS